MSEFGFSDRVAVTDEDRARYLEFAGRAVCAGGAHTLPYFRTQLLVEDKRLGGVFDPVTAADRACEAVIRDAIKSEFPTHGIMGEEYGFEPGNGLTWVIDPIDGTRAFMSGMVHWGVLLGLFDGQDVVAGAMYQPFTEELFVGDGYRSIYRRGEVTQMMSASSCTQIDQAVFATTGLEWADEVDRDAMNRMIDRVRLSRVGGDCYLHAMVGMGTVDFSCDAHLQPYDIQALVPIVRGAGGVVTTITGENPSMGGTIVCAANPTLYEIVMDVAGRRQ